MPNIWEQVAEEKALAVAAKIEAAAAKEEKVVEEHNKGLGATIVDDLKEAGSAIAGAFDKAIHGSQAPQSAEPQANASAPQAPAAAPQDARKATILAELQKLESEVQSLGG